jgi:uncharacterized Ntn-hydrolase superfamily protein
MTWSIIARDVETGAFGIAVATRFFAVGALVPHVAPQVGAVATQALVSPLYGVDGLRLLREGASADAAVKRLVDADSGNAYRQVHAMDAAGGVGAHTGTKCIGWCGHIARGGVSFAGNMLAGAAVLDDTAAAYLANAGRPFARRLIAALQAGEAAGGDKRGRQSAALVIYGEDEWPVLDLRVDDHGDPLAELDRLERVSRERFVHFRRHMPSRRNPLGLIDRDKIEADIAAARAAEPAP